MYASDVTQRKRAQVIYSDISKQKSLFDTGKIFRLNYQKGGSDYSYMMELEQGCIMNTCVGDTIMYPSSGNGIANMDPAAGGYSQVDLSTIYEYAYGSAGTLDDAVVPLPMGDMANNFKFFGQAKSKIGWNTNNTIVFGWDSNYASSGKYGSILGLWDTDVYSTVPTAYTTLNLGEPHGNFPAILLGNYDRRLNNIYTKAYSTLKYQVISLLVFFQDNYQGAAIGNAADGQYQVNIVKEIVGSNRQWIELRVSKMTQNTGFIAGNTNTNSNPVGNTSGFDPTKTDLTKLSPFNITNGSIFLNPCGSTYSTTGPAPNTSMVFQSDSNGNNWNFFNNMHLELA